MISSKNTEKLNILRKFCHKWNTFSLHLTQRECNPAEENTQYCAKVKLVCVKQWQYNYESFKKGRLKLTRNAHALKIFS